MTLEAGMAGVPHQEALGQVPHALERTEEPVASAGPSSRVEGA